MQDIFNFHSTFWVTRLANLKWHQPPKAGLVAILPPLQIGSHNIGPQGEKPKPKKQNKKHPHTRFQPGPGSPPFSFQSKTMSSDKTVVLLEYCELCWRRTVPHDMRGSWPGQRDILGELYTSYAFSQVQSDSKGRDPQKLKTLKNKPVLFDVRNQDLSLFYSYSSSIWTSSLQTGPYRHRYYSGVFH